MSGELSGRNVILTGATRGLGVELAKTFWRAGANLFLVARSRQGLESCAAGLAPSDAQRAHLHAADLLNEEAPAVIVQAARQVFDKLDVLVNNAGMLGPMGPVWENDWTQWKNALQVNLLAPIALCRACVPWMAQRRYGKILNLSGGGAANPRANFSAYAVSKTGLVRFSENLALETRELNIDVNCIAPGAMATDMIREIAEGGAAKAGATDYEQARKILEQGGASLENAAGLCLFLASSASDGISGKLISAVWDPWEHLAGHRTELQQSDVYTLRRIMPRDRGQDWGKV